MCMILHLTQIFIKYISASVSLLTLSICLNILSTLFSGVSSSLGKSIILPYQKYKEYIFTLQTKRQRHTFHLIQR